MLDCQNPNSHTFEEYHSRLFVVCFFCMYLFMFPFQVCVALSVNIYSHHQLVRNTLTTTNKRGILQRSLSCFLLCVVSVPCFKV